MMYYVLLPATMLDTIIPEKVKQYCKYDKDYTLREVAFFCRQVEPINLIHTYLNDVLFSVEGVQNEIVVWSKYRLSEIDITIISEYPDMIITSESTPLPDWLVSCKFSDYKYIENHCIENEMDEIELEMAKNFYGEENLIVDIERFEFKNNN